MDLETTKNKEANSTKDPLNNTSGKELTIGDESNQYLNLKSESNPSFVKNELPNLAPEPIFPPVQEPTNSPKLNLKTTSTANLEMN